MNFRIPFLLLTLALAACSSAPTQPTQSQQPIVNQTEDAASETRFSQSLNQLLGQVSQTQEIPLQALEMGFLMLKQFPLFENWYYPIGDF